MAKAIETEIGHAGSNLTGWSELIDTSDPDDPIARHGPRSAMKTRPAFIFRWNPCPATLRADAWSASFVAVNLP